ncbi:NADP-dependent oxidoreductase [Deinococcus koreensis]|uniref:Zinc-binding alcohol dehydrogenase n=1 Tax=Deinococcus koreensis TaxID=2054903 RepID=A0A2K3USX3_9DEIO|nr:NADP-dependent oxidoreductase [Deinococcus koreensis]PNY79641.1 zinc-binding alcohol dehydrogenase [Deinococcus koreensis]
MRAARFHRFGDPGVLQLDEVAWPAPRRDEVLIRVHASSINGTDLNLRGGGLGLLMASQLPFTPGFDVAGEVVGCGPQVTAFRPGDRVYSLLGHRGGGAAEYVAVRQSRVGMAPQGTDLVSAAAVPLSGLTALQALRGEGRLQPGRTGVRVLVYGASGGIGAFAVQLARILGAHVTGVARPAKLDYVRSLGADVVLSTEELDWTAAHEPWDVILDSPPALSFEQVRPALGDQGTLVSVRGLPNRLSDAAAMLGRGGPRFASVRTAERGLDLAFLSRLIESGELKIPVDRVFALDDIQAAHRYAEGTEVRGKVVVSVVEGGGS